MKHLHCLRCGNEWIPRMDGRPKNCPRCKQPRWDKLAKRRVKAVELVKELDETKNAI